jgi:hypothetical protein
VSPQCDWLLAFRPAGFRGRFSSPWDLISAHLLRPTSLWSVDAKEWRRSACLPPSGSSFRIQIRAERSVDNGDCPMDGGWSCGWWIVLIVRERHDRSFSVRNPATRNPLSGTTLGDPAALLCLCCCACASLVCIRHHELASYLKRSETAYHPNGFKRIKTGIGR